MPNDTEKRKEYSKLYREKNREKILEQKRKYYRSEQCKKKQKEWKEKNREKVLEMKRQEYQRNKERYREYDRQRAGTEHRKQQNKKYYQKHKKKILAEQKDYYIRNRETKLQKEKVYREKNKEKKAQIAKIYYQQHKEERKDYNKQYREKNRETLSKKGRIKRENRKIFYGKDPWQYANAYYQRGYYNYLSSFKNYLFIHKAEKSLYLSLMNKLAKGIILEDEALHELQHIQWTEEDEKVYQLVISTYKPENIGKEYHDGFYELKFVNYSDFNFIQQD